MIVNHLDLAVVTYQEQGNPKTIDGVFKYTLALIAKLPAEEKAGLVEAPSNGKNVVPYSTSKTDYVRCNRVCYPDGQLYKTQTDTPNGEAAWNDDGIVSPEKYVTVNGEPAPPIVVCNPDVIKKLDLILAQLTSDEDIIRKLDAIIADQQIIKSELDLIYRTMTKFVIRTAHGFLSFQPDGTIEYRDVAGPWEEIRLERK